MEYREYIRGRKVAVLGMGVSNTPLIRYLAGMGVSVTAFDKNEPEKLEEVLKELEGLNVQYSLGNGYLKALRGFDVVFRTPGIRFDIPELLEVKAAGAEITSEMEVFFDLCPAKIFAVTGSDGKTTTTTLIYRMLKEQGFRCWLGGNIGTPLLDRVAEISENDLVVLELSSFQLQTMKKSPSTAVITNLSPNHLDVHKSMDEYVDAKKNIFRFQDTDGRLILNYDNELTRGFAGECRGETVFFSRNVELRKGAFLKNGMLVYRSGSTNSYMVSESEILIPGAHNVENYLAAAAAVSDYVKPETIRKVATTFTGVEHRIELVRELNGIRFYNDSIASSPSRTIAGLKSFKQKVILIAGGKDKNIPYDILGGVLAEKVKVLVLIGQTAPKIEAALLYETIRTGKGRDIEIIHSGTYEDAVKSAYSKAVRGDVIILSPASTSFDMFRNFEERGRKFKEIVMNLK